MKNDTFDYRPAPFWFLNHAFEKDEIDRQLDLMVKAGVSGFFMHPRAGYNIPYLSEKWHDTIEYIVTKAEEKGLKAWLYDEDQHPSGIAGCKTTFNNPELAAKSLSVIKLIPNEAGEIYSYLGTGSVVNALAVTAKNGEIIKIQDITEYIGIKRPLHLKCDWKSSYYVEINKVKFPFHYRAETFIPGQYIEGKVDKDCAIYVAITDYFKFGGPFGMRPDNLNRESTEEFLKVTHESYKKRLGSKFGKAVPGIFTDEPTSGGYFPYTAKLFDEFVKKYGYDLKEKLYHLVDTFSADSHKVREDYWSLVAEMFENNFYKPVYDWCEANNLKFTGHIINEEDPIGQILTGNNSYAVQRYFHIPGYDIVGQYIASREFPALNLGGKLVSSAAHRFGKKQVISECMACVPYNFGLAEMKKYAGWLFALGVNWLAPHAFNFSYDGYRKYGAGKSFFFQDIHFDSFKEYSDFAAGIGKHLADSKHISDVCLLIPYRMLRRLLPAEMNKAEELRGKLFRALLYLIEEHIEFDIIDDDALFDCEIKEGKLICGEESFGTVIVAGSEYFDEDYAQKVLSFKLKGLNILTGDEIKEIKKYTENFTSIENADEKSDHKNLMTLRKASGDDLILFIFNNTEKPTIFKLDEKEYKFTYLYKAEEDKLYLVENTDSLGLNGFESMLLIYSNDKKVAQKYNPPEKYAETVCESLVNPQWDYIPPKGCKAYVARWDISANGGEFKAENKEFYLVRDIAFTELNYIPHKTARPYFDVAEVRKSAYPMDCEFKAEFALDDIKNKSFYILMETETLAGSCKMLINGKPVDLSSFKRCKVYDGFNLIAPVRDLKQGANEIKVIFEKANEFDGIRSIIYIVSNENL